MDEDLHDPVGRKRRRGGLHQRVQSQKRESLAGDVSFGGQPSLLADWLKEQWAWGQLSPQAVQHIASLAKKDMLASGATEIPNSLHKLSMLGTEGAHANNCHRDLWNLVASEYQLPQPLQVFMSMKVPKGKALQSIMLPHLVFHHVWVNYPDFWKSIFLPNGKDGLLAFWEKFKDHHSFENHWLLHQPNWMSTTIPLNLHGDAVPTVGCGKVWAKLMQCYSWASLLSVGSTKQRSFFIFGAAQS